VSSCMVRRLRALLWLAVSTAPLQGATLERLSLDDMIDKSTQIVRARVSGSYSAFSGDLIYTHYRLQVSERWKGPEQASLEVLVPGGAAAGRRQTFSGAPQLQTGKEYVFFLWAGKSGENQVIGLTQGLFQITAGRSGQNAVAYRPATMEIMLDPQTGQIVRDDELRLPLATLTSRIRTQIRRGEAK